MTGWHRAVLFSYEGLVGSSTLSQGSAAERFRADADEPMAALGMVLCTRLIHEKEGTGRRYCDSFHSALEEAAERAHTGKPS